MIERYPNGMVGKCGAVAAGRLVYAMATDPDCGDGIEAQTAGALADLERLLTKMGSDKAHLLQVTVYLSDTALKPRMDAVWTPWIGGEENWPQRACVGVDLDPGYLIEVVVIAALT